jgi:hypothetical protein
MNLLHAVRARTGVTLLVFIVLGSVSELSSQELQIGIIAICMD